MVERRRKPRRASVVAAWTLIWFGTILAVNPSESLSRLGVLLWGAGIVVQLVIVGRWFINRPAPRAAATDPKRRHATARV